MWVATGAFLFAMAAILTSSVRRPRPPTFAPSEVDVVEVGDSLIARRIYTLAARDPQRWVYFDFSRSTAVTDPDSLGWDLAVRRYRVVTNGGVGFAGAGGAVDAGTVPFASITLAPETGYVRSEGALPGEARHAALDDWYRYGFLTHLLTPRSRTYVIRTADGRYAKLRILSYYCPGVTPGCLTFEYAYQGNGSRRLIQEAGG